ncbi:HAD-IIIA family hydrolase [Fictibacillus sp. BK138]|uniref:HAD-IIIA family hydrolase n=1 Tax=Fictibacillus sp. BK138 TaxID=2512121 RepID=UPI001028EA68|nr:HAD-IIIA family hydrolase [Fictibacillus sp. BK138]RZT23419.1 histidinol-phosphate phosphatase family protein/HAD superfamily hydrolase (TIGR01662 family) [Fictibacillus sp. BK138]
MNDGLQAVFLDRDGTIGGSDIVEYPGEFKLFPYTAEVIERFNGKGIKVFSFTNQPGISRSEAAEDDFVRELKAFGFDEIYLCPHHHKEGCHCRKPSTGMLEKAAKEHSLNLLKCAVFGDRWTDIMAAKSAGCIAILVLTGSGAAAYEQNHLTSDVQPDHVAENLKAGADWVLKPSVERSR